jgi:serine phosphatase RsbU (regulator of sigma subunit)/CHASE3 domain sensor protein
VLLRRRIQLVFVALAVLIGVDFAVDRLLAVQRSEQRRDVTERWEPARDLTSTLLFSLVDQETAERSFIITGDEAQLGVYGTEGEEADRTLARLESVIGDDRRIQSQLRRTRNRIAAWRQLGAQYEIDQKQAGRDAAAVELVSAGTSERLFDDARTEIEDLRRTIRSQLELNEEGVQRFERRARILRLAVTLAAALAVVLSGTLLSRWLTRPLAALADAVRTVAGGRLDHVIPSPGPPELAGLGRDVEAMRRRILDEVDESTRARESLAQRGMIVLRLRDELAPGPVEPPAGLTVATRFRPSESLVAGDWYELRRAGDDRLTFVVADVSGHGPTAGVFALKTKQLVQVALQQSLGPAEAWRWTAEHLGDTDEQFLTGVIGTIDVGHGTLTYANAGHPPLLLVAGGTAEPLPPTGPVVGAFAGTWTERTVPFGPGSRVVAYSDGVLEVQAAHGAWAELAQLQAALVTDPDASAEGLADLCLDFHERHNAREHSDDVTIVAVAAAAS